MLGAVGGTATSGTPALLAQDTTPDTVTSDAPATPGSNARRLDSLRERAAQLRADIVRLRIEFGVRLVRLESGLVFRVPTASGRDRSGGEALRRVGSLLRRHYPRARVGVRVPGRDGTGCGSASDERRTRRVMRRLTDSIGFEASRVVPADCERLRPVLRGEASVPRSGTRVLLLVDLSAAVGETP